MTRLSTYKLGDEIETCKARLKSFFKASSDIPPVSWIEYFNKMQSLIYRLSGLKDMDLYLYDLTFDINVQQQINSIRLSEDEMYKNISRIKLVKDSIVGYITELPLKTFEILTNSLHYNPRFRKQPIWARDGEYILIGIGDLATLGTVTVKVYRTPIAMTTLEDLIDLPDENVPELEDFVLIKAIQQLKEPIPQELSSAYNTLKEMESKAVEQRPKEIKAELN